MSVPLLGSFLVGTLCIVIAYYIIVYTSARLKYNFDDALEKTVSNINKENSLSYGKDLSNADIRNRVNNVVDHLSNHKEKNKEHIDNIIFERSIVSSDIIKYKMRNDKDIEDVNKILANLPTKYTTDSLSKLGNDTINVSRVASSLEVKNAAQSQNNDSTHLLAENVKKSIAATSSHANQLFNNYMKNGDLSNYVNNMIRMNSIADWTNTTREIKAGYNELESIYANRVTITPILKVSSDNKRLVGDLANKMNNLKYVSIDDLKQYKFPMSTSQLDPNLIKGIQMKSKEIDSVKQRVNTELTPVYVKKEVYNAEVDKLKNINHPMFQFSSGNKLNVNGRVGVGVNPVVSTMEIFDPNSANWGAIIQNGNSFVSMSRGDGLGLNVMTNNTDGSKSAINVQLGNDVMFNIKNDGQSETRSTLTSNRINSSSQLCINNTCISRADIDKINRIPLYPPRYIR